MGNTILLKSGSYGWWTRPGRRDSPLLESVRKGESGWRKGASLFLPEVMPPGAPGKILGGLPMWEIDMGKPAFISLYERRADSGK